MATITNVFTLVRDQLVDTGTPPVWSDITLWSYIDAAYRAFITARSDLFSTRIRWTFAATATASAPGIPPANTVFSVLPTSTHLLIDIDATGTTLANATQVRRTNRRDLDANNPNWRATPAGIPTHFAYDSDADESTFLLYPMPVIGTVITGVAAIIPDPVTNNNSPVAIPDAYIPALVNYVCYRALMRDADHAANQARASGFFKLAMEGIGAKVPQTEAA